jgi:subtilisin family serine protease
LLPTGAVAVLTLFAPNALGDDSPVVPGGRLTADWASAVDPASTFAERSADVSEAVKQAESADHEIARARAAGRVSVLVYMEPGLGRHAVKRANVRQFAAQHGGAVRHEYHAVLPNVLNLRGIPEAQIEALRRMPGVSRVEMDEYHANVVRLHDSTPLIRALQSQISGAGLSADGSGVRICVVDTGIDSDHLMYSDRIDASAGYDFYNNDPNPEDDHGHGSHVSGIALGGTGLSVDFGCGAGSQAFQGVAPEATLIGAKVLNQFGGGYDSDIIAGINHCADQSPSGARADVINMSIGTGQYSGPCSHSWAVAANNAVANGVVAVAASGNENYSNALSSPACGANVIAVGMTWKNDYPTCEDPTTNWNWGICIDLAPETDDIGCFSNESDYLDVAAPGANIWSASNSAGGTSITGMSGTSMASPQVAGLAALILSMDGTLTPAEVRQIIRDGAIDLGSPGFDRAYGYGRIDAINSLQLVGPVCTSPADCDDGLWCNGAEDCVSGNCVAGTPPDCDDSVSCTDDSCNEATDSCDNVANDANCDNGLWCDGAETCHATLDCQAGTAPNCNDGVGCTIDSCNEGTDSCDNIPDDGQCDDGLYCNGAETCHATLDCQAGTAPDCDDGVGCTDDSCNEGTDSCDNIPNDANCDNGLWCDGAETCHATLDCQVGSDPCPGQVCLEATDACVDCTGDPDCDDGLYCNGAETCTGGTCQAGTAVDCDDGVACTDDSCNEAIDACDNVANDANCDNGLWCDGAETCHPTLDCQSGTAPDCYDGVGCTDDSCNEGTDSCDNIANDANCDNGLFCDGAETCHATLDCQAGSDPCPGEDCDEVNDVCVPIACDYDGTCESGEDCINCPNDCISGTGGAVCGNGLCEAGDGEDCVGCPADCNGITTGKPSGRFCCGATEGCGDSRCNEGSWSCTETPQGSSYCCGDGTCEGAEDDVNCAIDCGCTVPADCDDGVGCTDDDCIGGACIYTPNDAYCPDDGLFCNGTEYCDAFTDCSSTGAPCLPTETCNEALDVCEGCLPKGEPCDPADDLCCVSCHPVKLVCK